MRTIKQLVDYSLPAPTCVVLFATTDKDVNIATVGQSFLDELAAHTTSIVVVHPDVDEAIGIRCI